MNARARRRGPRLATTAAALGLLALGLPSAPARADTPARDAQPSPPSPEADAHFRAGVAAFNAADLRRALHEFEAAQRIAPHARTLLNIAAVHAQLGDRARALDAYERALADANAHTSEARRAEVERDVAVLRTQVATLVVTCARAGAEVRIDGELVGTTPLPTAVYVNSGVHRVDALRDGRVVASRAVSARGGATVGVEIAFEPDAAATARPSPDGIVEPMAPAPRDAPVPTAAREPAAWLPWALWAGTGAFALAATVTGGVAVDQSSKLARERNALGTSHDTLVARDARVRDFATITDVFLVAAAATACAGLYVTLVRPGAASATSPARAASTSGARAALHIGFLALHVDASF